MRKFNKKERTKFTPVSTPEKPTTLAGVFQLRLFIIATAIDSFKQRKFVSHLISFCLHNYFSREPMLAKTKATNTRILNNKEKNFGFRYVTPEALGDKINKDTRAKKEEEAELRAELEK